MRLFDRVELLALPTMPTLPPRIDTLTDGLLGTVLEVTGHILPFSAAGVPCTAQPVPAASLPIPASLQLVGPLGGEELLVPTAQLLENALG
ncbi:MAG: amidase [Actinomycetota bacterium]